MESARRLLQNEDGFALYLAIFVAAILMLVGVVSIYTSNTESMIVRNEGQLLREFYGAEAGVLDALEHYNTGPTNWLTDDFLLAGPAAAGLQVASHNQAGTTVAAVEARCIEDTGATINSLSAAANTVPQLRHVGPPPSGAGYSMKFFEARRYAVTATPPTGNTHVQVGAWKVFNKYN
jgi:Tfp pilus assembly protein PilX